MILVLLNRNPFIHQTNNCPINDRLPKFLNQVKHKTWFTRSISVQKSSITIESSQNERLFHPGIENTVSIIESRVKLVNRSPRFPTRPREFSGDDTRNRCPISLCC